jgi:hypothetical protein
MSISPIYKWLFGLCYSDVKTDENLNPIIIINEEIFITNNNEIAVDNNNNNKINELSKAKSEKSVNEIINSYFSNEDELEITRNEQKWNENYKKLKLSNFFG